MIQDKITNLVYNAIDELNKKIPPSQRIMKSKETTLIGPSGNLDSQGLVNLIVEVEEKIEDGFARTISLAEDDAMFQEKGPLRTIETLIEYINSILEVPSNG